MLISNNTPTSIQTAALDGGLAFAEVLRINQELALQTAGSSVSGLLSALDETGLYGRAMESSKESMAKMYQAEELAKADPFVEATSTQSQQHLQAILNGLRAQAQALQSSINSATGNAYTAWSGTQSGTAERAAAQQLRDALAALDAANAALKNGDTSKVNAAFQAVQSARNAAQSALSSLLSDDDASSQRIAQAQAVLTAANQALNTAQQVLDLKNSPIGRIMGETQTAHDLGNGYTLSTWGDSGVWTLVGPDGQGIIVKPDGTVDPLNGNGKGWKFSNTSTFVLPGDIKITVDPGSTSSLTIIKGINHLSISNLHSGSNPTTLDYKTNGRMADQETNDGYIFNVGSNTSTWDLDGNILGDAPQRENVATTHKVNEHKLDPTDVAISEELTELLEEIGYTPKDYDGDDKLNDVELQETNLYLAGYVESMQAAFNQALTRIVQANAALMELSSFLDTLRMQNDKSDLERDRISSEEQAVLADIEKKLVAALNALKGNDAAGAGAGTPVTFSPDSAETLLQRISQFTQQGVVTPASTSSAASATGGTTSTTNASSFAPPSGSGGGSTAGIPDEMGQSLRRAGRLLTGLGSFDIASLASMLPAGSDSGASAVEGASSTTSPTAPALQSTINQLTEGLQNLQTALLGAGLADQNVTGAGANAGTLAGAAPQNMASGVQGLFSMLSDSGMVANLSIEGFIAMAESPVLMSQEQLRDLAPSLLSLAGAFAAFGATQAAAQAGMLTTPSAQSNELRAVLNGLASLGTPGYAQSSGASSSSATTASTGGSGGTLPTSAEVSLGLQTLMAALSTLGSFGLTEAPPSGGTNNASSITFGASDEIKTISGNFYTDPELMQRLEENQRKAQQIYTEQLSQAKNLFIQAQETVQDFVELIKEDDLVKQLVTSDDLSDEQQDAFAERMTELRKDWGVDWGSSEANTPAEQGNLVSKVMQSGMMV